MVRDHRAQKLRIADGDLLANEDEHRDAYHDRAADEQSIEARVLIHHPHHDQFDRHHRRRHQRGHEDLVDVHVNARRAIDH